MSHSHGKLKFIKSYWKIQVGMCERRKNSLPTQTIFVMVKHADFICQGFAGRHREVAIVVCSGTYGFNDTLVRVTKCER